MKIRLLLSLLLAALSLALSSATYAQQGTTTGNVSDESEEALPLLTVSPMLKGRCVSGTIKVDNGLFNFSGRRATSNQTYVDGVKIVGEIALPVEAIDQISFLSGGIPAEYGDAPDGIVVIKTSNPGMIPWMGPARERVVKTKKLKKTGAGNLPAEFTPLG